MLLRSAKPSFFQKLYVTSKWHTTGKVLPTKLSLYVTVPYCSSLHLSTSHCFCRLSRRCLTAYIYIYHISMLFHLSAHLSTHLIYTQYPLYFKKHDPIHLHNPIWTITLHRLFNLVLSFNLSCLVLSSYSRSISSSIQYVMICADSNVFPATFMGWCLQLLKALGHFSHSGINLLLCSTCRPGVFRQVHQDLLFCGRCTTIIDQSTSGQHSEAL